MAFFALGTTQLAVALASRARPGTWANPLLPATVTGAMLLQLAALYLPPLQDLLGTRPLTVTDLAVVCALSAVGYAALRPDRVLHPDVPRATAAGGGRHTKGDTSGGALSGPDAGPAEGGPPSAHCCAGRLSLTCSAKKASTRCQESAAAAGS